MASVLGVSLVTLFFLLIPGLIGLKAFLRYYVKLDDLSRIDKLALSVVIGGVLLGLSLFLLNWRCWTENFIWFISDPRAPNYQAWSEPIAWCGNRNVATVDTIKSTPLLVLITLVGVESVVAAVVSGYAGKKLNERGDGPPREQKFIEQPWEYASKKTIRENEPATVITTSNEEITGTIHRIGTPSEDYDVLLKDPVKIIRDEWDREINQRDLGSYSYHHYRDISQIHFHTLGGDPGSADEEPESEDDGDSPESRPEENGERRETEDDSETESEEVTFVTEVRDVTTETE